MKKMILPFVLIIATTTVMNAQVVLKPKEQVIKGSPVTAGSNNNTTVAFGDYPNVATYLAIGSNVAQKWIVPEGVNNICVELWGGGGAGGTHSGGGGGGYIRGNFSVVPGNVINMVVGLGGTVGRDGERSSVSIGQVMIYADGGGKANESYENGYPMPGGGGFGTPSLAYKNFLGEVGQSGQPTLVTYAQYDAQNFREIVTVGNGGNAGHSVNTGATGGQFIARIPGGGLFDAVRPGPAAIPGGGGAANRGSGGAAGMIVIHY